jgi:O-antigen/teichoic acid export membrane protein
MASVAGQLNGGGRRVSWVLVDQALSSLGNFGLGLLVAGSTSARDFGAFGIAYSLYLLLLSASRSVASEPLLVRHADSSEDELRHALRESTGTALALGSAMAVLCASLSVALPEPTGGAVLALAVVLPGLLLEDSCRYAVFTQGQPLRAVVVDGVWTVTSLMAIVLLGQWGSASVSLLVLAWGATGSAAGVLGVVLSGALPLPRATKRWYERHHDLAPRFLGEVAVTVGATNLSLFLIGVVGGLEVVGALRGAEVLLGPARLLVVAAQAAAVAELVRLRRRMPHVLVSSCLVVGGVLAGAMALAGGATHLLPDSIGRTMLGDSWAPARDVLGVVALDWAAIGFGMGAVVGLRVLAAARRSLRVRVALAPLTVVVPLVGVTAGARGAAWGYATVSVFAAGVWWQQFRRAEAEVRVS